MRAAAPVDAPFARGWVERAVCALLYAAAGGGACAALFASAAAWPLAALLGAAAGAMVWRPIAGSLCWDGRSWSIVDRNRSSQPIAEAARAIDLGDWLLVRLTVPAGGRARWASLSARDAGGRWHDLRVALMAHGGSAVATEVVR